MTGGFGRPLSWVPVTHPVSAAVLATMKFRRPNVLAVMSVSCIHRAFRCSGLVSATALYQPYFGHLDPAAGEPLPIEFEHAVRRGFAGNHELKGGNHR
jgi:hypothetical protein